MFASLQMHCLAGGTMLPCCNLRSQKSLCLHTQQPHFITNHKPGHGQHSHAFHRAQKRSAPLPATATTCAVPLPQPLVIPFPAAYSKRNIKLGRSGTWYSTSTMSMGDKPSLSSGLPSAETALSPSDSLQNTGILIKRG